MNIIQFAIKRSLLMNLLTALLLVVGLYKARQMQREAFPSINFDILSVKTIYPGASPKEVELYVTTPLEKEVKTVDGLDEFSSVSIEGLSLITIKLDPDLSEAEKRRSIDDVQRAIDRVVDLPEDLPNPPLVKEARSGDLPIIEVAISGNLSYDKLHLAADELTDRLENINRISTVHKRGFREKEFWVEISQEKLERYNLSLSSVIGSLAARNLNLPGGAIETDSGEILVRTIGETNTAAEIANIALRSNTYGVTVRIKDVGTVSSTFEEEERFYRTNGHNSINLLVVKSSAGDIISLVDKVKKVTNDYLASKKELNLSASFVNDISFFVRNRLGVLLNNGFFGILLVLISLLLFLSPGIALVAAFGMPVAFMGAIVVMGYSGMTINLITMFALVIVLGMLVDDAIIVAENIWAHYENGEKPYDAAIKGASEVFWPVTATILTTIAAFSPLLMVSGIFGKFVRHMPLVVIMALLMSLLEAMFVLPTHALEAMKMREKFRQKRPKKAISERRTKLLALYERSLRIALRGRYLFTGFIFAILLGSVGVAYKAMPWVLFPAEGVEIFFVRADLPVNSSLDVTSKKFRAIEQIIEGLDPSELKDYVTTIGKQQDDVNDPFAQRGSHLAQIQVHLTPELDRDRTASEIIESLRDKIKTTANSAGFVRTSFARKRSGPPVGKPVAIRIKGDDLDLAEKLAAKINQQLKQISGILDVDTNYKPGKDELQIVIDDAAALRSLLTVRDIAHHIRAAFEGQIASYVRFGEERVGIRVRLPKEEREKITQFENILVPNSQNNLIKLGSIAHINRTSGINAIFHRDAKRTVTVTATIDDSKTTSDEVNRAIIPFLKDLEKQNPATSIVAGGEWEETNESLQSLAEAFLIAMGLIFLILATQFSSVTQPLVVMAAIPFGIIGVIWAFFFHGLPLSFLGLIGTIGLTGVVVNDSIVLVDFLNKARENGMPLIEAAVHAGRRRFRAVWLTTLTTVFGLLPLVYGIGGMDKFLQPAAVALGYGLIFGTVLVLFFVPAVYVIRVDIGGLISGKGENFR